MKSLVDTYALVKELLERHVKYRDSDELLVVQIWYKELKSHNMDSKTLSTYDFFSLYLDKKLTPAQTIVRARRKVNQKYPLLRGKSYKPRQNKQLQVITDLNLIHAHQ